MLVSQSISKPGIHLSFEFFPPKEEAGISKLYNLVHSLNRFKPDFCSVTWGAGGSTIRNTMDIVEHMLHQMNILTVMHFTGLGMTPQTTNAMLDQINKRGIRNVLVLRGDKPHQGDLDKSPDAGFKYASELLAYIRSKPAGHPSKLCLLVAGCPEGHPEAASYEADMDHLAQKTKFDISAIVTQFFFDNSHFYRFKEALAARQVTTPVSVGIMLITKAKAIQKMVQMSGCSIPSEVQSAIEKYQNDDASMESFGIDYGIKQIQDLMKNGIRHFHIYTLNREEPTTKLLMGLKTELGDRIP